MISVIIPLYNKENGIADAVNSVIHQTFSDFELIVINDGSTDRSLEQLARFKDSRLRVISTDNKGVSSARNMGIRKAKYSWIAFLDADDWWSSSFLENMAESIEHYPRHKIFSSGRNRVFTSGNERYKNKYLPKEGKTDVINYFKVISKFLPPINASSVVIEKSLFETYGDFNYNQKAHEDHDVWLRLCTNENLVFVNKPLSFYRKTSKYSLHKLKAVDFRIYLNTIIKVNEKLSKRDRQFFKAYVNRFVFLTYLKNQFDYTRSEREEVYRLVKQVLKRRKLVVLGIVNTIPFNMYLILKKIRSYG